MLGRSGAARLIFVGITLAADNGSGRTTGKVTRANNGRTQTGGQRKSAAEHFSAWENGIDLFKRLYARALLRSGDCTLGPGQKIPNAY